MNIVFVVGCYRSGTTMLGSMLGSPANAICPPESFVHMQIDRFHGQAQRDTKEIAEALASNWRIWLWNTDPFAILARLPPRAPFSEAWLTFVKHYAAKRSKPAADWWIDHSPANVFYATALLEWFPNAKFVHIVRDGRAVFASTRNAHWGVRTPVKAAHHWMEFVCAGLALERRLPDRVIQVRYEDLVSNPRTELERICAFTGQEFNLAMLRGDGLDVPGYTKDQHALVGSAPDNSRIDAWTRFLPAHEIEHFESVSHGVLDYLGYQPLSIGTPRVPSRFQQLWYLFLEGVWFGQRRYREFLKISRVERPARESASPASH